MAKGKKKKGKGRGKAGFPPPYDYGGPRPMCPQPGMGWHGPPFPGGHPGYPDHDLREQTYGQMNEPAYGPMYYDFSGPTHDMEHGPNVRGMAPPEHAHPGHPYQGHPYPGQPHPGHPHPRHPHPGHPHPGHPHPRHPHPGHPHPGHPHPGHPQSGQPHPGHPHPGHPHPGHPHPGHPHPEHPHPGHPHAGHHPPGHHMPPGPAVSKKPEPQKKPKLPPMRKRELPERFQGTISFIGADYGYIERDDLKKLRFSFDEFVGSKMEMIPGVRVQFTVNKNMCLEGKECAADVVVPPGGNEEVESEIREGVISQAPECQGKAKSRKVTLRPKYAGSIQTNELGDLPFTLHDYRCTLLLGDRVLFNLLTNVVTKEQRATNIKLTPNTFQFTNESRVTGVVMNTKDDGSGSIMAQEWSNLCFVADDNLSDTELKIMDEVEFTVVPAQGKEQPKAIRVRRLPEGTVTFGKKTGESITMEKPQEKPQEKPMAKTMEKPMETPMEKPMAKTMEKPQEKPMEKPMGKWKPVTSEVLTQTPVDYEDVGSEQYEGTIIMTPHRAQGQEKAEAVSGLLVATVAGADRKLPFDSGDVTSKATMMPGDRVQFNICTKRSTKAERATNIELLPDGLDHTQEQREKGVVTDLRESFGFIKCQRDPQLFFHLKEVLEENKLNLMDEVQFTVLPASAGEGYQAVRVKKLLWSAFTATPKLEGLGAPSKEKKKMTIKLLKDSVSDQMKSLKVNHSTESATDEDPPEAMDENASSGKRGVGDLILQKSENDSQPDKMDGEGSGMEVKAQEKSSSNLDTMEVKAEEKSSSNLDTMEVKAQEKSSSNLDTMEVKAQEKSSSNSDTARQEKDKKKESKNGAHRAGSEDSRASRAGKYRSPPREHGRRRSRSRSRDQDHKHEHSRWRSRSPSRERGHKYVRIRIHRRSRSRERSRRNGGGSSRRRSRSRSRSRERADSHSRKRSRSRSKSRERADSHSRRRSRSRSKERGDSHSRKRSRSRSKERADSHSRRRSRSRSRSRERANSHSRRRSRSRSKERGDSHSRRRSRSRSKERADSHSRRRSRSRSRERADSHSRSHGSRESTNRGGARRSKKSRSPERDGGSQKKVGTTDEDSSLAKDKQVALAKDKQVVLAKDKQVALAKDKQVVRETLPSAHPNPPSQELPRSEREPLPSACPNPPTEELPRSEREPLPSAHPNPPTQELPRSEREPLPSAYPNPPTQVLPRSENILDEELSRKKRELELLEERIARRRAIIAMEQKGLALKGQSNEEQDSGESSGYFRVPPEPKSVDKPAPSPMKSILKKRTKPFTEFCQQSEIPKNLPLKPNFVSQSCLGPAPVDLPPFVQTSDELSYFEPPPDRSRYSQSVSQREPVCHPSQTSDEPSYFEPPLDRSHYSQSVSQREPVCHPSHSQSAVHQPPMDQLPVCHSLPSQQAPTQNTTSTQFERFLRTLNKGVDAGLLSSLVKEVKCRERLAREVVESQIPPQGEVFYKDKDQYEDSDRMTTEDADDFLLPHEKAFHDGSGFSRIVGMKHGLQLEEENSWREGDVEDEERFLYGENSDEDEHGSATVEVDQRTWEPRQAETEPKQSDNKIPHFDKLQSMLQTIGLDLDMSEVSNLMDRTQERLYGKKQKSPGQVNCASGQATGRSGRHPSQTDSPESDRTRSISPVSASRREVYMSFQSVLEHSSAHDQERLATDTTTVRNLRKSNSPSHSTPSSSKYSHVPQEPYSQYQSTPEPELAYSQQASATITGWNQLPRQAEVQSPTAFSPYSGSYVVPQYSGSYVDPQHPGSYTKPPSPYVNVPVGPHAVSPFLPPQSLPHVTLASPVGLPAKLQQLPRTFSGATSYFPPALHTITPVVSKPVAAGREVEMHTRDRCLRVIETVECHSNLLTESKDLKEVTKTTKTSTPSSDSTPPPAYMRAAPSESAEKKQVTAISEDDIKAKQKKRLEQFNERMKQKCQQQKEAKRVRREQAKTVRRERVVGQKIPPGRTCTEVKNVWVCGHSLVFWAEKRAKSPEYGMQLGMDPGRVRVWWKGMQGMTWDQLLPMLLQLKGSWPNPDVIILHLGGNDLGKSDVELLLATIKNGLASLRSVFPKCKLVWSDILPRRSWSTNDDAELMESFRALVNWRARTDIGKLGGSVVTHKSIRPGSDDGLYRPDGVHLSGKGIDMFNIDLQDFLEKWEKEQTESSDPV